MTAILLQIEQEPSHPFYGHILETKRYLQWNTAHGAVSQTGRRRSFIRSCDLLSYESEEFLYSRDTMDMFTQKFWDDHVKANITNISADDSPTTVEELRSIVDTEAVSIAPLTNRSMDRRHSSLTMDYIHGHSLRFQNFVGSYQRIDRNVEKPYCLECGMHHDSPFHKLFQCPAVGAVSALRDQCRVVSVCAGNFHLALIFSRDRNLKHKFRNLVYEVTENSSFNDELLDS